MAEFFRSPQEPQPYQPASVDWYTPAAGSNPYGNSNYAASNFTAGISSSFEDEPPLLEELGIDLAGILRKTRAILLHRLNSKYLDDLDMGGALIFIAILGGLHLLMGKIHFGIILGWSVVHSVIIWFLVNQLAGVEYAEGKGLDLYSCCCVVGYCMLPVVLHSGLSLTIPRGPLSVALASLCVLWAAGTAARVFVRRCPALEGMRAILFYPCLLMYGAFALLSVY